MSTPWVDGLTIPEVLAETARRFPQRDALVFPQQDYRRSYADFRADVLECASALIALEVQPGEHVGIWATNWPQWVILQFACAEIGAVLVNINPAYRAHELEYVLNQADIATLFLTDRFKTTDYFQILDEVRGAKKCPKLRRVVSIKEDGTDALSWSVFRAKGSERSPSPGAKRQAGEVVNIQYTSGTTGFPKGTMLTHRNVLLNAYYIGERLAFTERDRLCIPVPLYHCFGCVMGVLTCAIYGSAMVFPAESFDPLATLQALQDERCTAIYGVPTMFLAELQHPRFAEFKLDSLRTGIMAGAPCPIELMKAVVEKMGAREMTIAYGLTEASPVITQTRTSDSLEHRVGTVGTVIPGVDVRIVQPGTMSDVSEGEQGELICKGHGVMKGYYNKPAETAQAITPDGWLRSGDLAMKRADGYYRITGRIKDMIIRGGENIFPREIEEFLYTHPAIADVQVVGLPDAKYGEEVSAWVRLKPSQTLTEESLKDFCRGKIAHFKVPRYVVFLEEYPTTVTGKIQKFKLREMGIERFRLQTAAQTKTA